MKLGTSALWVALLVIAAIVAIYVLMPHDASRPGQPSPHAIDQSQKR